MRPAFKMTGHRPGHVVIAGALTICLALGFSAPGEAVTPAAVAPVAHAIGVADGSSVIYVANAGGLYRSDAAPFTDWTRQATLGSIQALSPNPQTSDSVVYATKDGIYRSTDGGRSATRALTISGITCFARVPQTPATVYAGGGSAGYAYIYVSRDDGRHWSRIYQAVSTASHSVVSLAGSSTAADLIAAENGAFGGVALLSTDAGQTWHDLDSLPQVPFQPALAVAVNPARPAELWASSGQGGAGVLYRSLDGGNTWKDMSGLVPAGGLVRAIGFDALSGRAYVAVASAGQGAHIYAATANGAFERFAPALTGLGSSMAIMTRDGYLVSGDDNRPVQVVPLISSSSWQVAAPFSTFYASIQSGRLLDHPIGPLTTCNGMPCQYYVKGRLEQAGARGAVFGAMVPQLLATRATIPVGGAQSAVTYATLNDLAQPAERVPVPAGSHGGAVATAKGTFIPFSPTLAPAPGHIVPPYFWDYMNQAARAPGGWQQSIGLPLTEAVTTDVVKGKLGRRTITIQAFEKAVLTYDPQNAPAWRVERANIGIDFAKALPQQVR